MGNYTIVLSLEKLLHELGQVYLSFKAHFPHLTFHTFLVWSITKVLSETICNVYIGVNGFSFCLSLSLCICIYTAIVINSLKIYMEHL